MRTLDVVEFDTADGLQAHLGSLDDLHLVLDARGEAGYERNERMNDWCLMGRFALDSCGNTGKYLGDSFSVVPAEVDPLIKDVLSSVELHMHIRSKLGKDANLSYGLGNPNIPTSHVKCGECHAGWTVRNAHDAEGIFSREPMPLYAFAGQTIHAVNEELKGLRSRDGVRWFHEGEWFVKTPGQTDDKGREWRRVRQDYVIQERDEGEVNVHRFVHPKCYREKNERLVQDQFAALLEEAGFEDFDMQPVPNQYTGEAGRPWFRVTTKNGKPLLVGWRKRVIDIRWLADDYSGDITGGDEVTKSGTNAHAWNYKKASEYLNRLRQSLEA